MIPKPPTITISRFLIKDLDVPRNRSKTETHQILRVRAKLRSDRALGLNCSNILPPLPEFNWRRFNVT